MSKYKIGQGLSINMIIVAVLGLLILVILAVIMNSRFSIFAVQTSDCVKQAGTCAVTCGSGEAADRPVVHPTGVCPVVDGEQLQCCTG